MSGTNHTCKDIHFVNREYAEENGFDLQPEPTPEERISFLSKIKALAAVAMHEIGLHDGQMPRLF